MRTNIIFFVIETSLRHSCGFMSSSNVYSSDIAWLQGVAWESIRREVHAGAGQRRKNHVAKAETEDEDSVRPCSGP